MTTHSGVASRLFLSADLVGSTARKQSLGLSSKWTGDVLAFYQQFPYRFAHELKLRVEAMAKKVDGFALAAQPMLWKAVGDELIYTMVVTTEHQVCAAVDAWMSAMRETEKTVLDKSRQDLKGGAWIATFPLPDRAIAIPLDHVTYDPDIEPEVVNRYLLDSADGGEVVSPILVDYIGPSIDIGFRITSLATPRRFTLSVEAAWAIAVSRLNTLDSTPVYFAGETELRGVWAGRGYP